MSNNKNFEISIEPNNTISNGVIMYRIYINAQTIEEEVFGTVGIKYYTIETMMNGIRQASDTWHKGITCPLTPADLSDETYKAMRSVITQIYQQLQRTENSNRVRFLKSHYSSFKEFFESKENNYSNLYHYGIYYCFLEAIREYINDPDIKLLCEAGDI